jgi:bifunctional non-homologous end joining protein LigD
MVRGGEVGRLRALVYVEDGGLKVRSSSGRQLGDALPELAGLVDALGGRSAILDAELIALVDGVVDFYAMAPRLRYTGRRARWAATQIPVTFVPSTSSTSTGEDLTSRPLVARKQLLDDLHRVRPAWVNGWHRGDGEMLFEVCAQLSHEGVLANRGK